jgi:cytochrome c
MPNPRLNAPVLSANPTQLERGAYDFWLYCLPCHGDRGQGLTDEFRTLYPPDHQNCWASGCHGTRPYPDGWTLPDHVPAVIGPNALAGFSSADALLTFVKGAMPFEAPGSLDVVTYWDVVAFLAEKNGDLPDGLILGPDTAGSVSIAESGAAPAATPDLAQVPTEPSSEPLARAPAVFWGLAAIGLIVGGFFLLRDLRRRG